MTGLGYDDRDFEANAFEVRCSFCGGDGEGEYMGPGVDRGLCPQCKGVGTTPTTHGADVLAFLRRHIQTKEG
jgi:DnaJ-class molecular chaperone